MSASGDVAAANHSQVSDVVADWGHRALGASSSARKRCPPSLACARARSAGSSGPGAGRVLAQVGNAGAAMLRKLAPFGLQMAISAAAYSTGLGLFQVRARAGGSAAGF